MDSEDFMFHGGDELRLTLWVDGQPRAREYNLRFEPGGLYSPWLIVGTATVPRPTTLPNDRAPDIDPPFQLANAARATRTGGPAAGRP